VCEAYVVVVCSIEVLKAAGQLHLAFVCAKAHGLEDEAKAISEALGGKVYAIFSHQSRLFVAVDGNALCCVCARACACVCVRVCVCV
jgi:hypothetical protein